MVTNIYEAIEDGRKWSKKVKKESRMKVMKTAYDRFNQNCRGDPNKIKKANFWFGVYREIQEDLEAEFKKYNLPKNTWSPF